MLSKPSSLAFAKKMSGLALSFKNFLTSLYKTKTSVKTIQVISVSSHGVLRYWVFPSFKISMPAELINIHFSALEQQQVLLYELWTLKMKIFWLSGLPWNYDVFVKLLKWHERGLLLGFYGAPTGPFNSMVHLHLSFLDSQTHKRPTFVIQ